jgi:integrase
VLLGVAGKKTREVLERWRRDVCRAAKAMGVAPERFPLSPLELVPLLEKVRPGGHRLGRKTWSNLRSTLKAIAKAVGAHARKPRFPPPLSEGWDRLVGPRLTDFQRLSLLGFVPWCDGRGVGPSDVTEAPLEDYGGWRASRTYTCRPSSVIRQIRTAWNGAVRGIPGWPQRRLGPPDARLRKNTPLPVTAFPAAFQADFAAWVAGMHTAHPFKGRKRALSEATIAYQRRQVLVAATLRADQLGGTHEVIGLERLVTPQALRAVLERRYADDGGRWAAHSEHMVAALIGVARHHLDFDEAALEPLRKLQSRVKARRPGRLTEKTSDRLAQFDDRRLREDLYKLSKTLCDEAEGMRGDRPAKAARLHRHGILLYILLRFALRRRDLFALNLDEHIVRDAKGRAVGIRIPKTKNGRTLRATFPPDFVRLFARHVEVFRPLLPGASGPWLLPDKSGEKHGSIVNQTTRLAELVQARLGIDFNVHLARHLVATLLFEKDENNVRLAQQVLLHTSSKTTSRMYGELNTTGAQQRWGAEIDELVAEWEHARAPSVKVSGARRPRR